MYDRLTVLCLMIVKGSCNSAYEWTMDTCDITSLSSAESIVLSRSISGNCSSSEIQSFAVVSCDHFIISSDSSPLSYTCQPVAILAAIAIAQ